MSPLELFGQPLGIGRGHEDPVMPVADDVAVAGNVGGDHWSSGGKCLRQDHSETLPGKRRSAEKVGLVEVAPELFP